MSKNKEIGPFISASGIATDIVHKLAQAVAERGGGLDDLRRIISDPALCGELADRLVRRDGTSLAQTIADGKFGYVNPDIIEANFPLTGPIADVSVMMTLTQKDLGGQDMTTSEIEAAIDQKGYRPATLAELLACAKAKWDGRDLVVALGSSWVNPAGRRSVPYLCEGRDGRGLGLGWSNPAVRWSEASLFLVVRK